MSVRGAIAEASRSKPRRIFISYRRDDSRGVAGRLHDRFSALYGEKNVFFDVDSISPGLDFGAVIQQSVSDSHAVLAVIGSRWLSAIDGYGRRRLDNPNDLVVLEIALALESRKIVIPVLVDNARMPRADELPPVLQRLARLNAAPVGHASFHRDVTRLFSSLDELIGARYLPTRVAGPPTGPGRSSTLLTGLGPTTVPSTGPKLTTSARPAIDWRSQQEFVALVRNHTFLATSRLIGYDPGSVDLFRDQVESEMDRRIEMIVALNAESDPDMTRMPVGQVLSWRFASVHDRRGYDRDGVDEFVETVREGFARLETTIERLLASRQ